MRAFVVLGLLFVQVCLAQPPSQRELNGYVLGQHIETLEPLGEPEEETETGDGWVYRTFVLQEKPLLFMVFKFPEDDPDFMIAVQVGGDAADAMTPFLGLRLGASDAEVKRVFGAPTATEKLTDPARELWTFDGRNYSFEFEKQKLTSIQIFGYEGFAPAKPPVWSAVRSRLLSADLESLMSAFSADAEIYKDDDLYGIDDSMRKVLADPTSEFRTGLTLLVAALRSPEMAGPVDANLRIADGATQHVIKFAPNSPVLEIVFLDQAGEARIWEVHLRGSPLV